jgi:uncharacterized protein (TIGR03000 family)
MGASVLGLAMAGPSGARDDDAPATIRVRLPADARLTIDGAPTKATSADRAFITPPLPSGKDFYYMVRAEFVRDGASVTVERRITVRAGQETTVSLSMPSASEETTSYYYDPAAAQRGARPGVLSGTAGPEASFLPADVGGARNNWKPDFSDPFTTVGD